MRQVFLPPIPHKFPFLVYTFTALTFSTTPLAFRALSKAYFSSSQVIRQTGFSYLSLNLPLWTQAFLLSYFSLSLYHPLFLNLPLPFSFSFPLSLHKNRQEIVSTDKLHFFLTPYFWLLQRTKRTKWSQCSPCVYIYLYLERDLVFWTSKLKLPLQGKKQIKKTKNKPRRCYVILQSNLTLKAPTMKIISVC